jgi:uncharacterized protein involved in response to NO
VNYRELERRILNVMIHFFSGFFTLAALFVIIEVVVWIFAVLSA